MKFEDLVKTLDPDTQVEILETNNRIIERILFKGKIRSLKTYPDYVMRIIPQSTSREVYLEIQVY
jgi:hypothetical protein